MRSIKSSVLEERIFRCQSDCEIQTILDESQGQAGMYLAWETCGDIFRKEVFYDTAKERYVGIVVTPFLRFVSLHGRVLVVDVGDFARLRAW